MAFLIFFVRAMFELLVDYWRPGPIMSVVQIWGVVGFVAGIAQWFVLRRRVHQSGWWVLASTVGGLVGGSVVKGVLMLLKEDGRALWGDALLVSTMNVSGAMGAAVVGAITGFVLILLLRHPVPEA